MRKILTIAGSDPSGGAGIQADLKTIAALGCYGMSAITAVTVQNTLGVSRVFPLPPDLIEQQIDAVLSDMGADAIKIGMLYDEETILARRKSSCVLFRSDRPGPSDERKRRSSIVPRRAS